MSRAKPAEIALTLDKSMSLLRHVQQTVNSITAAQPNLKPMDLCRQVVAALHLPPAAANPLVARSFVACTNAS